jgi:hypothetical protein
MIPARLEDLIWQGKARSRTYVLGAAGSSRIPVQKNTFLVIYGIQYFPFIDQLFDFPAIDQFLSENRLRYSTTLALYDTKNRHKFNFRANFSGMGTSFADTSAVPYAIFPGAPTSIDCYCIFSENVRVNIKHLENAPELWTNVDYTQLPDSTDELNSAETYATTGAPAPINPSNTLRTFLDGVGTAMYPLTDQFALAPVTQALASYEHEDINSSTNLALQNPAALAAPSQNGFNYPLVNFQMVECLFPLPEELKR